MNTKDEQFKLFKEHAIDVVRTFVSEADLDCPLNHALVMAFYQLLREASAQNEKDNLSVTESVLLALKRNIKLMEDAIKR